MIKKILFLLLMLMPVGVMAQQAVGTWHPFSVYEGTPTSIVDTQNKVYYVSLGHLFAYDKKADETRDLTSELSDAGIVKLDYNPLCKFLFIGYENGNIDLLYDNGRVVNLPDIKEAQLAYDKKINEVDFMQNLIYVATKFGLVIFNSDKRTVVQSGIYDKDIKAVGAQGDYIIINADNHNYAIHRTKQISRFDNFVDLGEIFNVREMKGTGSSVIIRTGNQLRPVQYDIANAREMLVGTATNGGCTPMMRCADGKIRSVAITARNLHAYGDMGERTFEKTLPAELANNSFGTWNGPKELWAGSAQGVGCYDVSGETMTVKHDRMTPADAVPMDRGAYFAASTDGSKLYLSNSGSNNTSNPATVPNAAGKLCVFEDDGVTNLTPVSPAIAGITGLAVNPFDSDMAIVTTRANGVYFFKDGKQVKQFSPSGSTRQHGVSVDNDGNVWVMTLNSSNPIQILPADKVKNLTSATDADWVSSKAANFSGNSDGQFAHIPGTNVTFFSCALYDSPLGVYDTNGTVTNTADDKYIGLGTFIDQDGKTIHPVHTTALAVDSNKALWVGTDAGLYTLPVPAEAVTGQPRANRLKVARNDGSGFADYLLDGEWITGISVDGANNKWIGTKNSGLYYVSATGDAIIEHFTTDNSMLPTNTINKVWADKSGNGVYVATNYGVLRYSGFHSPGEASYENVYAYPNPVRPGYSGWITIKGLMDNSLVKIADASGSVVFQGRSDGGSLSWDGCNSSGARVKSGVYYVFASQNEGGSSSAAVTKILIMN